MELKLLFHVNVLIYSNAQITPFESTTLRFKTLKTIAKRIKNVMLRNLEADTSYRKSSIFE